MAQVTFKSGSTEKCDYTAGADIAEGQVIVTTTYPRIADRPIANGALGALVVRGGVWLCTGDAAIAVDKKVYWVDASNKVSEDANSGANKAFGQTVSACSGDGSTCLVYFDPAV